MNIDLKGIKCIFIDFDGTLVDSVPILFDNYMNFLKRYDVKGSEKEFLELMGPTIAEFVPILKERHHLPSSNKMLIQVYQEGLRERYENEAFLVPGAREFLDYIHSLALKMVLVTSSPYQLINPCLEKLKLIQDFSYIISGEKVKKTKPDPEIFQLALKTCSIKPEQAITIEDSYNGLLSSLEANILTIAINNKYLTEIPQKAIVVNGWHDLIKFFEQTYEQ